MLTDDGVVAASKKQARSVKLWPFYATLTWRAASRQNPSVNPHKRLCFAAALTFILAAAARADEACAAAAPAISGTNSFYIGNRAPLEPAFFLPLPIGAVQPKGWLLEMLRRQGDGLCGHLGEISMWLEKSDNAWLSRDGKGKHGWEEVPYWLRGYIEMAYILNDPKMIAESQTWIDGALNSQRPNGDFGPDQHFDDDGSRDFWANMLMMFALETYYEHTHDVRVMELLRNYFKYQLTVPDEKFLTHFWQKMRGGDNLYSVYWFYNRTGEAFALDLAQKIHRCTADWEQPDNLPTWHNVNIAEGFREPGEYYLLSHALPDLAAAYSDFHLVRQRYGQVPGGMFGGDENCRPGYSDPRQAIETCGMVEQMFSDQMLLDITGDPFWADNCEDVAFNMYPTAFTPDMRALRYLTAPNMVLNDSKNHSPGIQNDGPFLMMNPFSSRCCQHNHSLGWPSFDKNLWLATPDNGLCAALYSACSVTAQAGSGEPVTIVEDTHYPFDSVIMFTLHMDRASTFPLYFRVPAWCHEASLGINRQSLDAHAPSGRYLRVERAWKDGDVIQLDLPMRLQLQHYPANHDSVSVNYGPLLFSLEIGERYVKQDPRSAAMGDSGWQPNADQSKWPAFEILPETAWNYGLDLPAIQPEKAFTIHARGWPADNFPFTPEAAPIEITAPARRIPQWTLDQYELCSPLQASPAYSDQPVDRVKLIPLGAARLRISAFPTASDNPAANHWKAPAAPAP